MFYHDSSLSWSFITSNGSKIDYITVDNSATSDTNKNTYSNIDDYQQKRVDIDITKTYYDGKKLWIPSGWDDLFNRRSSYWYPPNNTNGYQINDMKKLAITLTRVEKYRNRGFALTSQQKIKTIVDECFQQSWSTCLAHPLHSDIMAFMKWYDICLKLAK
jgi:hypothetical protein